MGGLASQQEATQDPFPVSGVGATGETAEVAAEVAEEALGQVGSAQAVAPGGGPAQVGQHAVQFGAELVDPLRGPEAPAAAEAIRPEAELAFVVGLPEPPELAAELAAAGPGQRRGERFQIPKPMRQTELVGGPGIDEGRRLENGRGIVPDDQLDLLQAALPEASEQLDVGLGGLSHGHPQHAGLGGAIHPAAVA